MGIKDFIYLDMEKISSLYSQLIGGIIQSIESSQDNNKNSRNLRNYDFKIFKHEAGGIKNEGESYKEIRVSHHDIYNKLEDELDNSGYTVRFGSEVKENDIISGTASKIFENSLCVKAEGNIVLEDYKRITRIANNYDAITELINQSIRENYKKQPEVIELINKLESLKEQVEQMKNGAPKRKMKNEIKKQESALDEAVNHLKIGKIDEWIIDGLQKWVDVFLPDIFNIRLYPFNDINDFHIMGNLKRKNFLDDDIESLHYQLGSKPTITFTMLGVITSIPKKENDNFNPMREFENIDEDDEKNDALSVEKGFRGVFRGFDGLEDMIRTCRYPRIMVQPIAIYRQIQPNKNLSK